MNFRALAEAGYIAYGKTTKFKNFRGAPMPVWNELPQATQAAWEAAAVEICRLFGIAATT